jgi:hypothetical protein
MTLLRPSNYYPFMICLTMASTESGSGVPLPRLEDSGHQKQRRLDCVEQYSDLGKSLMAEKNLYGVAMDSLNFNLGPPGPPGPTFLRRFRGGCLLPLWTPNAVRLCVREVFVD